MRNFLLLAGAAALAASTPALAEKGGKGGSHGKGGQSAHAQGGGKPDKGGARGPHVGAKPDTSRGGAARGGGKPDKALRQAGREKPDKAWRGAKRQDRVVRTEDRRPLRELRRGRDRVREVVSVPAFRDADPRFVGLRNGCPPGLAKKRNGCLPPGQAKKLFGVGDRFRSDWFPAGGMPLAYRGLYYDTDNHYYRYDSDGFIYRVDRDAGLISSVIPLFGGGFAVGQPLPMGYDVYNVPLQYRDVWYDTDEHHYRYGDGGIYRVDAETGMIESVVALLAGDLNVGGMLPAGYDVYNVPLDYRDTYYDTDDYLYRYADGNIYQVDAKTQIVQAIVEMLL